MPPIYDWVCQKCKKHETTIKPMAESDTPPDETQSGDCPSHEWKKEILQAPQKAYGAGWGSDRKGRYNSNGW